MGKLYGIKIKSGIITMDDVPKLWKSATEKWIQDNP